MKSMRALVGVAAVVAIFYLVLKLLPVYMSGYQFQDQLESISRLAAYAANLRSEDDVRKMVEDQARDLNLPVKSEDIHIVRQGNNVMIWTNYTVHVDLPAHPMDIAFHPAARNGEKMDPSAVPQYQ